MRKGVGAGWIVLIIIIVAVGGIFLFYPDIFKITEKPKPIEYKNDVVTIEWYYVDNLSPDVGSYVIIEFLVQNNADKTIPEIWVNFFGTTGFGIDDKSLECQEIEEGDRKHSNNRICIFENLDSLDCRKVTLRAKAEDDGRSTIYFSINYTFSGLREVLIPVVDGTIRQEPFAKFRQSNPTVGPVVLDIEPLLERQKVVDGKTVKEYWAVSEREFDTKFKFSHIGAVEGKISGIEIKAGDLKLEISDNLEKTSPCDFDETGSDLYSNEDIKIAYDVLTCSFKPTGTQSEYIASIKANFTYMYEYQRSEDFTIQP